MQVQEKDKDEDEDEDEEIFKGMTPVFATALLPESFLLRLNIPKYPARRPNLNPNLNPHPPLFPAPAPNSSLLPKKGNFRIPDPIYQ